MESVWSVFKLSTESVGSRRELVANCVHTADANAIKQFLRVDGVYWALDKLLNNEYSDRITCINEVKKKQSGIMSP